MLVRQVGYDQSRCDVGGAMCLRPCVFVWVFVFVKRVYHGCSWRDIFELESKDRANCQGELGQPK